ncbi:MAG: DNA cytosine methyltransferase [Alphaproteobacteria bacterium]|nr:DNA cytosine methyltransferase [Alphaproteobacteria bacterium]
MNSEKIFPVVDVFAGPGGLGEGFASFDADTGIPRFQSIASIENEQWSFRTLHLRHFLRSFSTSEFPDEYYDYIRGQISIEDLYRAFPQNRADADRTALDIELGEENREKVRDLISDRLKQRNLWVLVGGPPCQAYSLVGRSRMKSDPAFESDTRHFLYREYLQIIIDHAPPVFVMENVKGLLSAKVGDERVIDRMISDLRDPGIALNCGPADLRYRLYSISEDELPEVGVNPKLFLVRAEKFGVPQARHRIFIVGVRDDIGIAPSRLRPGEPPTLKQVIGGLPPIRSGVSRGKDSLAAWQAAVSSIDVATVQRELNGKRYAGALVDKLNIGLHAPAPSLERRSTLYPQQPLPDHEALGLIPDSRLDFLEGHEARSHMPSDLQRYAFAASFATVEGRSPTLADFPKSLLPAHNNVRIGREGKMFSDRFRVQLPDRPSTTITSHIAKDGHYFIHYDPTQCRSLTVREAARLQTFPDNYRFLGPRTAQYHQVGNAVPPYLARQIAAIVADLLDRAGDLSR